MGFDYQNFGVGLITGWATAYIAYRARRMFQDVADTSRQQAAATSKRARRGADRRYIDELINRAERSHLAGNIANLSDILVEPKFFPPPQFASPDEDTVMQTVFHVVPQIHDHPFLHAPYNTEYVSISELASGDHALALLGSPGSGRTTALMAIALYSLGHVAFSKPEDIVQQQLDEEEAELSDADREIRQKQRASIEQRAKERLAQEQGMSYEELEKIEQDEQASAPTLNRLMPVYIHLADVDLSREFNGDTDPAEPLVRAVQYRAGRVTTSTIPRSIYRRANRGQLLLLVDGFDELPDAECQQKLHWLRVFADEYCHARGNYMIVVGPAIGYGALTQIGLTPMFLRPWADVDINLLVKSWTSNWAHMTGTRRRQKPPASDAVQRANINNRMLYPPELIMKLWANLAEDVEKSGIEGWIRAYLKRHLPRLRKDQSAEDMLIQLGQVAALQLDRKFITEKDLTALVTGKIESVLDIGAAEETLLATDNDEDGKKSKKEKPELSAQGKLLDTLERSGLLMRYRGQRFRFRHSFVASYLASLVLQQASQQAIAQKALEPSWNQAVAYASMHTPVDEAIRARLTTRADILQNNVLELARWLAYAGNKVTWREPLLKHLGNMLTASNQYPLIRQRTAAALLDTRDKEVLFIFRQAARNANPLVRQVSCLGMGALGDEESLRDLVPLMDDQESVVQLAAGLALGAIGTQDALEAMVGALTSGSEQLRQAVAEAFAAIPHEGYPVLFDAIEDNEMMVRRAAVFGLKRIRTTWAIIAIFRAFLEDEQWYVRSAAQQAFQDLQHDFATGPIGYPPTEAIDWLGSWAARQGESMPTGDGANEMLLRALQEGDPMIRRLSAETIGQLGLADYTRQLYTVLRDREEAVRTASHEALAAFQMQIGAPLPTPA